jgi:cell division protein FtsI/penicillin-binding protein 2
VRLTGQQAIANRPRLFVGGLLLLTGVQLVTLGLLAEVQARTYHESQNKPTYVIREILQRESVSALERAASLADK